MNVKEIERQLQMAIQDYDSDIATITEELKDSNDGDLIMRSQMQAMQVFVIAMRTLLAQISCFE